MTVQVEKAYQRQNTVNENAKNPSKVNQAGRIRYWKNIGLGFTTPKSAMNGRYIDKKCPYTGDVSIRGRIIRGVCHSTKMKRSVVLRRNYLHFVSKYQRYEKRHKNFTVHCSPAFEPKVGDDIIAGQCRSLSKTITYNVLSVVSKAKSAEGKKFDKN